MSKRFDKEVFIESVKSNLKTLYRQTLVDATKQQVFQGSILCGQGYDY